MGLCNQVLWFHLSRVPCLHFQLLWRFLTLFSDILNKKKGNRCKSKFELPGAYRTVECLQGKVV